MRMPCANARRVFYLYIMENNKRHILESTEYNMNTCGEHSYYAMPIGSHHCNKDDTITVNCTYNPNPGVDVGDLIAYTTDISIPEITQYYFDGKKVELRVIETTEEEGRTLIAIDAKTEVKGIYSICYLVTETIHGPGIQFAIVSIDPVLYEEATGKKPGTEEECEFYKHNIMIKTIEMETSFVSFNNLSPLSFNRLQTNNE